jgi:AhpC/TSA family
VRRLAVVAVLVLALALLYRSFGGAETGTGSLTLPPPEPNENTPAKNFTARDVEGNSFELSDSGVYVLAFWSPLNQSSNRARPGFIQAARKYGEDATFAVIYVNGAREDRDAPYDRLYDPTGRLASRYNVKRVPRLFVVRNGVISWVLDEYYPGYERDLKQKVDEALAQRKRGDRQTALLDN